MVNIHPAIVLIGGGTGALDAIDGAGLSDGDAAIVITDSGVYYYHLNATSGATENSPFRISPDANAGTKRWHLVGTTARIGALVELTANEDTTSGVSKIIPWDVEIYDDANFWVIGSSTRLTVPIGVTKVKVRGTVQWTSNTSNYRALEILKNGSTVVSLDRKTGAYETDMHCDTPILSVSASDYFELRVWHNSSSTLQILDTDNVGFSIEAVGFA